MFIINDIQGYLVNGTVYIKQNGAKSLQILSRFYSSGHISMPSKSIFMSLFLYVSFLSSRFFRTNIQNKKSKVNSFYVFLYFFCFTNIIAGLSSSSTFIRHGWCVNRFKRNTNLPGNAFVLF